MEPINNEQFVLASFLFSNWLNILFGLFGVVGCIFGYLSWKFTAPYKHLFELADKHIDKTLTDEQLSETKEKLNVEAEKIKELQNKIRHEIPIEARRAVLRDKLETNIEQIQEVYISLNKSRKQLEQLGDKSSIPIAIEDAIKSEIQPEYLINRKKAELRNYLTLITATAAISSAILPYPFSRFASWFILGLLGLPVLFLLIRLSWKDWKIYFRETVFPFIKKNLHLIGAISILFGFFSFGTVLRGSFRYFEDFVLIVSVSSVITGIMCLFAKLILKIEEKRELNRTEKPRKP